MRKKLKKLLVLFLVLAMTVTILPATALASEAEEGSVELQEEEVGVKGTDSVGNLLADTISEETAEDAENAQQDNYIIELEMSGNTATVSYQASEKADVVVAIYAEDTGKMVASGEEEIDPDENSVEVSIEGTIPDYYVASAYLLDENSYEPICTQYTTQMYTKELQDLLSKTTDDFEQDRVLNFDDDKSNNYVVYKENILVVDQSDTDSKVIDNNNGSYTITKADESFKSLKEGDIFSYQYEDGTALIIKIASIIIDGDMVTIVEDDDIGLTDVFEVVKIETDGTEDTLSVDTSTMDEGLTYEGMDLPSEEVSTQAIAGEGSSSHSVTYSIDKKIGNTLSGTLKGSLTFGVTTKLKVYISMSYQYISLAADYKVDFTIDGTAKLAVDISLAEMDIVTPIPGMVVIFQPSIPISLSGKVGWTASFGGTIGAAYDSDTSFVNKCTKPKLSSKVDFTGTFSVGVKGTLGCGIIKKDLASVTIEQEAGVEVVGKDTIATTSTSQKHTCKSCIEGIANGKVSCKAKVQLTKKIKKEQKICEYKVKLKDFYYSRDFKEFDWTKCPHISYKVTVKAVDESKNPLENVTIDGTGLKDTPLTNSAGTAVFYLPNGTYDLEATVNSLKAETTIHIKDETKTVKLTLKEEVDLSGDLELYGQAERLDDGSIRLTELKTWQSGSVWYSKPIGTKDGFSTSFTYWAGEGRSQSYGGADGIVLNIAHATGLGSNGEGLGFVGTGAYGIELDSYPKNSKDPDGKHIAIIKDSVKNHLAYVLDDRVDDSAWHTIKVTYDSKVIEVYLDGSKVLACDNISLNDEVYFGISASTGSGYNKHLIKNFSVDTSAHLSIFALDETVEEEENVEEKENDEEEGNIEEENLEETEIPEGIPEVSEPEGEIQPMKAYIGSATEDGDKRVVSFEGLVAGKEYVLLVVKNAGASDMLSAENLLYINQGTADEDGKLSFIYVPRTTDNASVRAYGPEITDISECEVTLSAERVEYDGKAKQPEVEVMDYDKLLVEDRDYVVIYSNNINIGTATAIITGIGSYTGIVEKTFTIEKGSAVIKASNFTKTTSAKAQSFSIGAKCSGNGKLTYKSNNKYIAVSSKGKVTIAKNYVGKATITINAAATSTYKAASKKITVTVNPAKVSLKSVKNTGSKKMTVKWSPNKKASGYQIQYSTSSNFAGAKTVTVSGAKSSSKVISKLVKGKKYYVRVRTYKKVSGTKYYSSWSSKKSVKISK